MADHRGGGGTMARAWHHLEQPVRILVYLLIALVVVMLYHETEFLVVHLFNVLLLFVFAAIIALLLTPLIDRAQTLPLFTGRRVAAVLLLYVVIIGLIAGVVVLVTPALIEQAKQLPALEARGIQFVAWLQYNIDQAGIPLQLSLPSATNGISTAVLGPVLGILTGTIGTLINVILVIVISIYFLAEGRKLIASMRKLFPGREEVYDFTLVAVGATVGQYSRGQLIMSALMGTYTGVGMTLIGVPYAVVLGILTFFLEFLPLIGAPVGMGLAVIIALVFKGPLIGLLAAAIAVGGHIIEAYVVGPRVTGSVTRLHPLVAMAALLVGAELGGILGALFGVPIAALLNVFLGALYRSRRGHEAPLSQSPTGEVHAESLPRLSEEISEVAEEGPIEDEPVPHTAGEGEGEKAGRKAATG
ncbi:MAG TPA: AI-2E family transporter [Candidatus Limnocylindrales bacterium]|nr:AI-2E family transporter [Candidatus Limnocylindrales bacterium]